MASNAHVWRPLLYCLCRIMHKWIFSQSLTIPALEHSTTIGPELLPGWSCLTSRSWNSLKPEEILKLTSRPGFSSVWWNPISNSIPSFLLLRGDSGPLLSHAKLPKLLLRDGIEYGYKFSWRVGAGCHGGYKARQTARQEDGKGSIGGCLVPGFT